MKKGNGNSFIFSLRNNGDVVILRCTNNLNEVYNHSNILCSFGGIFGFIIKDDCNIKDNTSMLNSYGYYENPQGINTNYG